MAKRAKKAWGDGTVYESPKGSGIWYAQLKEGPDGRRPKRRASSEPDAYAKLAELIADRDKGLKLGVKLPTVAEFLDTWLEEVVKRSVKQTTHRNYTMFSRLYVKPHIGNIRLKELTRPHVQAMVNTLGDKLSPSTVRSAHQALYAALEAAIEWKYVSENVADRVKLPKVPRGTAQALSIDEARRLLGAVEDHRLGALYQVLLTLGLRKGEVLGLRWRDLHWDKAELSIAQQIQVIDGEVITTTPKSTTSRRTIPVPPALLERLRAHWRNQLEEKRLLGPEWKEHGLIFASEVGTPLLPRNLTRMYYLAQKTAKIPHVRLHDLRHTCGTIMGDLGVGEMVIAAVLGHSSGSITSRYVHPTLPAMRAAVNKVEKLLLGEQLQRLIEGA